MRLIFAIVQDYDVDRLLGRVRGAGLQATRLASTGGYLRTGNATVLMGVADETVPMALALLGECCGARRERPAAEPAPELPELYASGLAAVAVGGGVAFVTRVARFERIV
jgi:uncharacterized protein YaaQ